MIFATAFRWDVTADDELLLLGKLDFDPGAGAPARGGVLPKPESGAETLERTFAENFYAHGVYF